MAFIITTLLNFAVADDNLNSTEHQHYISKTYASAPASATHTAKNEDVTGISLFITKINDGDNKASDYNYIRMYLHGGSPTTAWLSNSTPRAYFISGEGERTSVIRLAKYVYYEFYPEIEGTTSFVMTFYGNSTNVDAYAYIREKLNDKVSTSY